MPDDLLSEGSILQAVRDAMTPEACQDVEVIGWLYQFYISEKKDEVIGSKQQDRGSRHPRGHAALHAALDRALPGGELAGTAVDAQPAQLPAG